MANDDREVRAALEQAQAALSVSRRELERLHLTHETASKRLEDRARAAEAEVEQLRGIKETAARAQRELERVRAQRDLAVASRGEVARLLRERDAARLALERSKSLLLLPSEPAHDEPAVAATRNFDDHTTNPSIERGVIIGPAREAPMPEVLGPAGRWFCRVSGLFLVGSFLASRDNVCGLILGGAMLVVSFLD